MEKKQIGFILIVGMFLLLSNALAAPLRVNPNNPLYFIDDTGKAVYLAGEHSYGNFPHPVDPNLRPGEHLDWTQYLDFLEHYNHNFIRFWTWEDSQYTPLPFQRTGPGKAFDGGLKFNLNMFKQSYFDELKTRVAAAETRGIYISVMLFQGWSGLNSSSVRKWPEAWPNNVFNKNNNINNIDGDPNNDGMGEDVHKLTNAAITSIQEKYVRKVVDTINQYDNVLYEISNESVKESVAWQYHMINFLNAYQQGKPKQHPVGITGKGDWDINAVYNSPANWISPFANGAWGDHDNPFFANPPIPTSGHVSILDSDHIGNFLSSFTALDQRNWSWKSFTRGHNPIDLSAWKYITTYNAPSASHLFGLDPSHDPQRKSLGDTLSYANRMDLVNMSPSSSTTHCSTRYCLRNPNKEYLVYQPSTSGNISVQLPAGDYEVETFDTIDRSTSTSVLSNWGGGARSFSKPSHIGQDWVLYLKKATSVPTTLFDNFNVDTTSQYTVTNTWTKGGVGSFVYNGTRGAVEVITGDNIGLQFGRSFVPSTLGTFKITFLPYEKFPSSGNIIVRLWQDDSNYLELTNTDGSSPGNFRKVVGGTVVAIQGLGKEYQQDENISIKIAFDGNDAWIVAFGEVANINAKNSALNIERFSIELKQQSAYFDNLEFTTTVDHPPAQPRNLRVIGGN